MQAMMRWGFALRPHDDMEGYLHFYHDMDFHDVVHGKLLGRQFAIKARKLEMDFSRRMDVCTTVTWSQAKFSGVEAITTKYIDTSKVDEHSPEYGTRFVGRGINAHQRPQFFATTPPPESLE